jgi:hypothetical protein
MPRYSSACNLLGMDLMNLQTLDLFQLVIFCSLLLEILVIADCPQIQAFRAPGRHGIKMRCIPSRHRDEMSRLYLCRGSVA